MIARKLKVALGVAVAVVAIGAFSPSEAEAGHRGRSFGFYYNSGGGYYGGGGYYRSGYYSRGYYGGGYCGPTYRSYYRPYCGPRYYAPRPVYRYRSWGRCGW